MNNSNTNLVSNCFVKTYEFTKQITSNITLTTAFMVTTLLSACQITEKPVTTTTNLEHSYSQYYLWLKTLTTEQILTEKNKQTSLMAKATADEDTFALSKLILIHSLPNTSLHRPYKAKRFLNEYLLKSEKQSNENLAFTMLLRDQLNTQLKLLHKQEAYKKDMDRQRHEQHAQINQLQKKLNQVNHQLTLLKRIDENINKRG